mmetsp:Transcript_21474/g.52138  ORF Transcript_21474/g.52138 Transcript_21474/m.52138 type:complete len:241 (+) Transcript_21474:2075-2797(+)
MRTVATLRCSGGTSSRHRTAPLSSWCFSLARRRRRSSVGVPWMPPCLGYGTTSASQCASAASTLRPPPSPPWCLRRPSCSSTAPQWRTATPSAARTLPASTSLRRASPTSLWAGSTQRWTPARTRTSRAPWTTSGSGRLRAPRTRTPQSATLTPLSTPSSPTEPLLRQQSDLTGPTSTTRRSRWTWSRSVCRTTCFRWLIPTQMALLFSLPSTAARPTSMWLTTASGAGPTDAPTPRRAT